MDQFKGKTAFVTGGASGIGLALCRALGQRGMNVAIADDRAAACTDAVEMLRGEERAFLGRDVSTESCHAAQGFRIRGAILCNNASPAPARSVAGIHGTGLSASISGG